MHLAGGDADLAAHAELAAIGELRRGIMQEDGRIDLAEETLDDFGVFGDHRLGVMRGIAVDMRDGSGYAIDQRHRDHRVEIFGAPILFRRRLEARQQRQHIGRGADFAAGFLQRFDKRLQMRGRDGAVDQQGFGRAADAGTAHLGVDDNLQRHVEITRGIDIDMAETFEMGKDRHARFRLDAADEALAAARHDDVDGAVQARQHGADGGAVGGRHKLDRIFRQAGLAQAALQAGMDRPRRLRRIGTAAQDDGIAGLEAQRAGIGGHVRPAFIDDADDAERRAHPLDMQPVRPVPFGNHVADRILESGDGADALGHVGDALFGKRQPVDEGGQHVAAFGRLEIGRIGGEDLGGGGEDGIGHRIQRPVLGVSARHGQWSARGLGTGADVLHQRVDPASLRYRIKHGLRPSPLEPSESWSPCRRDAPWRRGRHNREWPRSHPTCAR